MDKIIEQTDCITVILPIYNVEHYLQKCLDTVLNQTYKNLEIILVDDGSTDRSGTICDENARLDNRIIVIHKTNGGLSDARNAGINIATGKYIAFIDSDDYIHEEYIEKLYEAIIQTCADVSVCSFFYVDEIGTVMNRESLVNETNVFTGKAILDKALKPGGVGYVVAWNKLYKKEIFENLRYEKGKIHEDEFINYKLFWRCNQVVVIKDHLYFYRQRKGSIQGTKIDLKRIQTQHEMHLDRIRFYKDKEEQHLLTRSLQSYFNWSTRCFLTKEGCKLIPEEYKKRIQIELRQNACMLLFSKEVNIVEKAQDLLATANVILAGKIKALHLKMNGIKYPKSYKK